MLYSVYYCKLMWRINSLSLSLSHTVRGRQFSNCSLRNVSVPTGLQVFRKLQNSSSTDVNGASCCVNTVAVVLQNAATSTNPRTVVSCSSSSSAVVQPSSACAVRLVQMLVSECLTANQCDCCSFVRCLI